MPRNNVQLVAELSAFSGADALQWATNSGLTGRLSFRSEKGRITLRFDNGRLVLASSDQRVEAFGRHLFANGMIDEIDLAAAMVHSRKQESRIGKAIVDLGILSKDAIRQSLREHTLNLACDAVIWREGKVTGERRPVDWIVDLDPEPLDPTFVLLESARRQDEMDNLLRRIQDSETVIQRGRIALPQSAPARWRLVIENLNNSATVGEHYRKIGGSYYQFLKTLDELNDLETLKIIGMPAVATEGSAVTDSPS